MGVQVRSPGQVAASSLYASGLPGESNERGISMGWSLIRTFKNIEFEEGRKKKTPQRTATTKTLVLNVGSAASYWCSLNQFGHCLASVNPICKLATISEPKPFLRASNSVWNGLAQY